MDESPDRTSRVRRGEIVIAPMAGEGSQGAPHDLVHHWVGAIFIPGATMAGVHAVVHDYNNYQRFYQPVVISSKELAYTEDSQEFQMVWQRKVLFVRAAMQEHYRSHDAGDQASIVHADNRRLRRHRIGVTAPQCRKGLG